MSDLFRFSTRTTAGDVLPAVASLVPSPYLHASPETIHNPMTDRTIGPEDPEFAALQGLLDGSRTLEDLSGATVDRLREADWLYDPESVDELSRLFFLKYVSLEAHTVCNQGCYFCPVSVDPREAYFMPMEQYRDIVAQLARYRETIEVVFMINYNEPTADKRFVEQVRTLKDAGLPPATLTNGTGLTPRRVDELVEMGGLRFLSINLSTVDRERYSKDRAGDHLNQVLRNLDYAKDKAVAEQMRIIVLGRGDEVHSRDFQAIRERFRGTRFEVEHHEVMDRAGYLQIGLTARNQTLCGCDNLGSRPIQHLHITPKGKCLLCCEDYDEHYVVGDLTEQTVNEVLTGPELTLYRRWIYGLDEAPDDFICRNCVFARVR